MSFKNVMPQNFAIPPPIISYILQRNNETLLKNPNEYYIFKICSLCKYFFSKLRLIPAYRFSPESEYLDLGYHDKPYITYAVKIPYERLLEKTKNIYFCPVQISTDMKFVFNQTITERAPSNIVSKLIPKILNHRINFLAFYNQELTFQEWIFLTSNNKTEVILTDCKITDGNDSIVPAEKLLEVSPNLYQFSIRYTENELDYCTPITAQKIAEFSPFKYLSIFHLQNVSDDFSASHFTEFIKKNYKNQSMTHFGIRFKESVDLDFIEGFKDIVDAALTSSLNDIKKKTIFYDDQTIIFYLDTEGFQAYVQ